MQLITGMLPVHLVHYMPFCECVALGEDPCTQLQKGSVGGLAQGMLIDLKAGHCLQGAMVGDITRWSDG